MLARKPLSEKTVAANVLRWRTGALNVGACKIAFESADDQAAAAAAAAQRSCRDQNENRTAYGRLENGEASLAPYLDGLDKGRWPANVCHDGSAEVVAGFPDTGVSSGGRVGNAGGATVGNIPQGKFLPGDPGFGDSGSAARFFYSAKADADDRIGSKHPTVKPVDLLQWLVRLVTPPGGIVLDPFAGTGTTGEAAWREGCRAVLIEREAEYRADIARRMAFALEGPVARRAERVKARGKTEAHAGPLFGPTAAVEGGGRRSERGSPNGTAAPADRTNDRADRAQTMSEAAE